MNGKNLRRTCSTMQRTYVAYQSLTTLDNFAEHFNFKGLMSSVLCYEKAAHKGLDYGSVRRLFMVWGVPQGHELLRDEWRGRRFPPKILHRFSKQAINRSGSCLDLN
ncbi:MAG: hypothetical protein ACLQDI_06405 [Syntrophobacteraceae bacterium]